MEMRSGEDHSLTNISWIKVFLPVTGAAGQLSVQAAVQPEAHRVTLDAGEAKVVRGVRRLRKSSHRNR